MRVRSLIAAGCVLLGCAACGFKGPLYLPQQNAAVVTHPATTSAITPSHSAPASRPGEPKRKADGATAPPP